MKLALLLSFASCMSQAHGQAHQSLWRDDTNAMNDLIKLAEDVISDTDSNWGQLEKLKYNSRSSAAYEIGYLMKTLQEFYRKQVDLYNTTKWLNARLYMTEMVLYLDEIEHHYWQVEHVGSMMHEIEQKHGIKGGLSDDYDSLNPEKIYRDYKVFTTHRIRKIKKSKQFKADKWDFWAFIHRRLTSKFTRSRKRGKWPLDYGWDVSIEKTY